MPRTYPSSWPLIRHAIRDCSDQSSMKPGAAFCEKRPPDSANVARWGDMAESGIKRCGRSVTLAATAHMRAAWMLGFLTNTVRASVRRADVDATVGLVRFAIAPAGQVLSAVVESSTLGNPRVELCTAQAVRRWEFPKPTGGGMVMVSYPFVMSPAGGGA